MRRRIALAAALTGLAMTILPPTLAHAAGTLNRAQVQGRIEQLRGSLSKLAERLRLAEEDLQDSEDAVARHRTALAQSQSQQQALSQALKRQAAGLYMIGDTFQLEALLATQDVATAIDRLRYLQSLQQGQERILEDIGILRRHSKAQAAELVSAMQDAQTRLDQAQARRAEVTKQLREYAQLLQFLGEKGTIIRSRVGPGGFVCPVVGPIAFGDSFGERRPGHFHKGIDMLGDYGQRLVAALSGTIVSLDAGSGYGLAIVLRDTHGTEWLYAHLQSRLVRVGDRVAAGQLIGRMGCSGRCYGPHLHFEWHPGGGAARDPYRILNAAC